MKKYRGAIYFVVVFLCVGGFLGTGSQVVAADSLAWDRSGNIVVHDTYQSLDAEEFNAFWQAHMGVHARQSCYDSYIAMTPSLLMYECWFASSFGVSTRYGNIVRPAGATYAGLLGESAQKRLIPTPKEGVFLALIPQEDRFSLQFRTLSNIQLEVVKQEGDYLFYDFINQPSATLIDESSNPLLMDDTTASIGVWYAKNGRYMLLANMAEGEVSRIDLETFRILTTTYTILNDGDDRFATFDITSDGKFLAVNLFGHEPRLINFQSCAQEEQAYVSEPVLCAKRLLGNAIRNFDPQTGGLGNFAVFENDTTLAFYTSVGQEHYSKFLLFAPGTWQSGNRYIALGDSFASGEGVGNYYKGTDNIKGNMCHLSKSSYPFLLGSLLRLDAVRSVACSGAKIQNIIEPDKIDNTLKDSGRSNQYDTNEEDPELGIWLPGRNVQAYYPKNNPTDIITISISGNDMNFGSVVDRCVNPFQKEQTCFVSRIERAKLVNNMDKQYTRLVGVFQNLQRSANIGARVYAIGYPSTIKVGGYCDLNVQANREEIEFLDAYTMYANTIVKKAARRAGVTYVDMTTALWGHRLCEGLPKAMNGFTLYRHIERKFIHPHSYHPNQFGNALFAMHIREQTNNFTIPNPRPDLRETGPGAYDAIYAGLFDSVDETLEGGYIYTYEQMTGYVLEPHLRVKATFMQPQYGTVPGAKYEHWLHSDPIFLGESIADTEGNIDATITIPADVPIGMHTLKTIGKNTDGEDIEIWSNVYVAFSADDWDGNGIPNDQQICPIEIPGATVEQQKEWCGDSQKEDMTHSRELDAILENGQIIVSHGSGNSVPFSDAASISPQNISGKERTATVGKNETEHQTITEHNIRRSLWNSAYLIASTIVLVLIHLWRKHKHEAVL